MAKQKVFCLLIQGLVIRVKADTMKPDGDRYAFRDDSWNKIGSYSRSEVVGWHIEYEPATDEETKED